MVSFREYPTIVKNAAIIAMLISISINIKIPKVITISCTKAMMLPAA